MFSYGEIVAQNNSGIIAKAFAKTSADSSYIAVNKRGGWQSLVSHLTQLKNDSVLVEILIKNNHAVDLKQGQLIGRIKQGSMLPKTRQKVPFNLVTTIYQLIIEPDGRCYLRLVAGTLPADNSIIVPIRAAYKL